MEVKENILQGLELALKMEADGKQFYQMASENSSDEAGKKLFAQLALEEDEHARRFVKIYNSLKEKGTWPQEERKTGTCQKARTIFAKSLAEATAENVKYDTEMKAVETARKMEDDSITLYEGLLKQAVSEPENSFVTSIIAEEREHSLALNDYAEYLRDPAGWFAVKEHHSLDGV